MYISSDYDCKVLSEAARYVAHWMHRQPHVKEESITDWLLYEISEKRSNVAYHAFTRHEESSDTGADWEWWFLFHETAFKYRVQAKKVKTNADNYPSVAYSNKNGLQIEMLVDSANRSNAIPLYALYTAPTQARTACCADRTASSSGVFIVGASALSTSFLSHPRTKVTSDDLLRQSVPLSCFACCPLVRNESGHDGFLDRYFASEVGAPDVRERNTPLGHHSEVPRYVEAVLRAHSQGEGAEWIEKEYRHDIGDTKALLIYDLRNKEG